MIKNFTEKDPEEGTCQLQKENLGPVSIASKMLQQLGLSAKKTLLKIYNACWTYAIVPQAWTDATMMSVRKKGKDQTRVDSSTVDCYRSISLTSCTAKLMERLINCRLTWHLEKVSSLITTLDSDNTYLPETR